MEFTLNATESRVLGVLIEKQMSTPDYYPLTLNSLVNACNQKSNRNPVMMLDENEVVQALDSLRTQHLVWQVKTDGSRMPKFEHNMKDVAEFPPRELAVLCELLLRGPQTGGELRSRTTRLTEFHGLAAVEHTLQKLAEHEKGPFVIKLSRQPGHKENRYAQLFFLENPTDTAEQSPSIQPALPDTAVENERIGVLEDRVKDLADELQELKVQFVEFKKQFD